MLFTSFFRPESCFSCTAIYKWIKILSYLLQWPTRNMYYILSEWIPRFIFFIVVHHQGKPLYRSNLQSIHIVCWLFLFYPNPIREIYCSVRNITIRLDKITFWNVRQSDINTYTHTLNVKLIYYNMIICSVYILLL